MHNSLSQGDEYLVLLDGNQTSSDIILYIIDDAAERNTVSDNVVGAQTLTSTSVGNTDVKSNGNTTSLSPKNSDKVIKNQLINVSQPPTSTDVCNNVCIPNAAVSLKSSQENVSVIPGQTLISFQNDVSTSNDKTLSIIQSPSTVNNTKPLGDSSVITTKAQVTDIHSSSEITTTIKLPPPPVSVVNTYNADTNTVSSLQKNCKVIDANKAGNVLTTLMKGLSERSQNIGCVSEMGSPIVKISTVKQPLTTNYTSCVNTKVGDNSNESGTHSGKSIISKKQMSINTTCTSNIAPIIHVTKSQTGMNTTLNGNVSNVKMKTVCQTSVGDSLNEAGSHTANSIISKKQATGNTSCSSNIAPIIHVTKPQTERTSTLNGNVSNFKMKTVCQTPVGDSLNDAGSHTANYIISKKQATGNTSCTSNIAPIIHVTKPQTGMNTLLNGNVSNDKMKAMCQTTVSHKPSNQKLHKLSSDDYKMFLPSKHVEIPLNSIISKKPKELTTSTHSTAKKHPISDNEYQLPVIKRKKLLSPRKDSSPTKKIFKQDLTKENIVEKLSECIGKTSLECFEFDELIKLSGNLRFEIDDSKEEIVEINCSVSKHKQSSQEQMSTKLHQKIVEQMNAHGESTKVECSISQHGNSVQDKILNKSNQIILEKMNVQRVSNDVECIASKPRGTLQDQIKEISNKLNQKIAEKLNVQRQSTDGKCRVSKPSKSLQDQILNKSNEGQDVKMDVQGESPDVEYNLSKLGHQRKEVKMDAKVECSDVNSSILKPSQSRSDDISNKLNQRVTEKINTQEESIDGTTSNDSSVVWGKNEKLMLIHVCTKEYQKFYEECLNYKSLWENIYNKIKSESFSPSITSCKQKMQSLQTVYRYRLRNEGMLSEKMKNWLYADAMSDYINLRKKYTSRDCRSNDIDKSVPVPDNTSEYILMYHNTSAENETKTTNLSKVVKKAVCITSEQYSPTLKQAPTASGQQNEKCHFCPFCDVFFPDAITTQNHLKEHATTNENFCSQCNESFLSQEAFFAHSLKKHNLTMNKLFGISLQCLICNKHFNRPHNLLRHFQSHRPSKDFACDICGKRFQYECYVRAHKRGLHGKQKPYKCEKCGETFSFSHGYNHHMVKHLGLQFACDQCDKTFPTSRGLKAHKIRHDTTKRCTCEYCGKSFSSQAIMKKSHLPIHSKIKPFICTICGKGYPIKWQCQKHEKQHDGERFPCDICGKSFQTKEWMKFHQRRHLGDFNIFCDICGRGFMHKSKLQVHLKTHKTQNDATSFSNEFFPLK